VVGSAICERSESPILALQHKTGLSNGIAIVAGDITRPLLGLRQHEYKDLCEQIDTVIHCAATVTMMAHPDDYSLVNVSGSRNVAAIARDAQAKLIQVSTAFVANIRPDSVTLQYYEKSKLEAEHIVRAIVSDVTIVRPSIVVGDAKTGAMPADQGLHHVLAGLVRGPVRIVPGDVGSLVDFVPRDYVANVICAIARSPKPPEEIWLTSGDRALTIEQIVARVNEFVKELDLGGERARTVSYDTIDRLFVPVFLPELPAPLRARIRMLLRLARHLNTAARLPSSAERVESLFRLALPNPSTVLDENLHAWWSRACDTANTTLTV
jgi:thioester reductase-like protein